jgi:hypothetical protein
MKLNITFTYHYILFLGIALLLTPATFIRTFEKAKELKIEKTTKNTVTSGNMELLHSEMLFRF